MKKIAFINNKGGVSKTASSIAVANILADEHNKKVLLVDIDPQRNTTARFSEIDYFDIFERLMESQDGKIYKDDEKSIEDILMDPSIDLHTVIQKTKYDNIDIIPAQLTLSAVEEAIPKEYKKKIAPHSRLKVSLEQVEDEYDYCIIDCGPSVGILNVNALNASDEVYIPLRPDGDSLIGMAITRNLIEEIREWNENLEIGGVFFTCFNNRERMSTEMFEYLDNFLENYDFTLLPIIVGNATIVKQASVTQASLLELDKKNKITNQYRELCEYILAPNKKIFLKNYKAQ